MKNKTWITIKDNAPTTIKQTTPTTTNQIYLTTNSTSAIPQIPKECQQAVNYTESWRTDYDGSNIKPRGPHSWGGYACDLHISDQHWFRFAGAAGNRMLDFCVKEYSCGARAPLWIDSSSMPKEVGVEKTATVYESYNNNCKFLPRKVKVMRCSWDTTHHTTPFPNCFTGSPKQSRNPPSRKSRANGLR